MADSLQKLFLTKVHIKRFKSIEDVEVDIKKGLNILIGKNGSGKSNFLSSVDEILNVGNTQSRIFFSDASFNFISEHDKKLKVRSKKIDAKKIIDRGHIGNEIKINQQLFIEERLVYNTEPSEPEVILFDGTKRFTTLGLNSILITLGFDPLLCLLLKFEIPNHIQFVTEPGVFNINSDDFTENGGNDWYLYKLKFVKEIFWSLFAQIDNSKSDAINLDRNEFYRQLIIQTEIIENLKRFSPIEEIRFNENINIYHDDKSVTIDNIKIDFKINGYWQPWSQLSDGTKRLFYLITEITSHTGGLVLVEEPELGVHPHQFGLIMDFLKEQAEEKQIIISTHSPQALNYLSANELDHLLIAKYDNKKGTQITHLTDEQKEKAKGYMDEVGFLSDYWMLSDLE